MLLEISRMARNAAEATWDRKRAGLAVIRFDLPRGTVGGYYPACNVLVPPSLHDALSEAPVSKAVPVKIERDVSA
jgi:hypothetical protein